MRRISALRSAFFARVRLCTLTSKMLARLELLATPRFNGVGEKYALSCFVLTILAIRKTSLRFPLLVYDYVNSRREIRALLVLLATPRFDGVGERKARNFAF